MSFFKNTIKIHITFYVEKYRQRGRFAGFALFVSNTGDIKGSTLCYKDGPELPPLNFTTTCTEYGRYVIFYNERMDEAVYPDGYQLTNVYTELCEVIVKGTFIYCITIYFLLRLLLSILMQTISSSFSLFLINKIKE